MNRFILKICMSGIISVTIILCTSCKNITHDYSKNKSFNLDYLNNFDKDNTYKHNQNTIDSNRYSQALEMTKNLKSMNIVYFPLDQYCILPVFFDILDTHAAFLRNNPSYHIIIEGHTDERGTPEYNIALGERRAYSVEKYLKSKGVLSYQMNIISYGKEKPVSCGHTEEAYSKNRRVVLVY